MPETVLTPDEIRALPLGEYAFPGPLRDRLVAAILSGEKTATASLAEDYRRCREPLPRPGDREAVVDSDGRIVCVTENLAVDVLSLADVPDEHAVREGEGDRNAAEWRAGHERFWASEAFQEAIGGTPVTLDDDTEVVCVTFTVIARL